MLDFNQVVLDHSQAGHLVVQPRMGFSDMAMMRAGLEAVKGSRAASVGTITLDSYTRVNDIATARVALDSGHGLNGYPIINHGTDETQKLLKGLLTDTFPIQVRHGSSLPVHIFESVIENGLSATEGGPISYCLPYSRTPLPQAVEAWRECTRISAIGNDAGQVHIESFGGCMLGQMCPPALLVAISILEGMFFEDLGLRTLSFSYAQNTSMVQDIGALRALRKLGYKWVKKAKWHIVVYTYMGVFPRTEGGALNLLKDSVDLCRIGGAERLIVKTITEASRIPTIAENILSIETATKHWEEMPGKLDMSGAAEHFEAIFRDANLLIQEVAALDEDIGEAIIKAFSCGLLDLPYCLHVSNRGEARSFIDELGALQWQRTGQMPISPSDNTQEKEPLDPFVFLKMLSTVENRFDTPYLTGHAPRASIEERI